MKKIFGLMAVAVLLSVQNVWAQSYAETAMMFSRTKPTGSARIMGMGGAQVSLGGDFSSAYSNPAGLGMYNRSEFTFTPGYTNVNTSGDYFSGSNKVSTSNNASQSSLNMNGLGLVFSREFQEQGFIRGAFALTFTKTNNFFRNIEYDGTNPNSSLIDYFLDDATGDTPDQFGPNGALYNTDTELAYLNYLIGEQTILDPSNDPKTYFTDVTGIPFQKESIHQEGGQSQWNFSYGANFNDKYYLGAGLGIASVRYRATKSYREDFENDPLSYFKLDENLEIRGSGINLTLGGIMRPVDFITIGASVATPTYYSLTDTWSADMNSSWKNFEYLPGEFINDLHSSTDELISEYSLSTPWKFSAGATFFIQKYGLITLDIDRLNYGSAKYGSKTSGAYDQDNAAISNNYVARTNIRLGGEVRVDKFRFRGGVGLMPDPLQSGPKYVNNTWSTASIGAGYRKNNFFIDLAYVKTFANGNFKITKSSFQFDNSELNKGNIYRPYRVAQNNPSLQYDQVGQNFIATLGFTF